MATTNELRVLRPRPRTGWRGLIGCLGLLATSALVGCGREIGKGERGESDDAIAWYLTMHGNEGGNAVVALDRDGGAAAIVCSARDVPKDVSFRQPRSVAFLADGSMLVASAFSEDPGILRFGGPDEHGERPFVSVFADLGRDFADRIHPYDIAVAPDGTVFVSDQDANLVTWFAGLDAPLAGAPIPAPVGAKANWTAVTPPRDGIFIGSDGEQRDGLRVVRGLAFDGQGRLLVVDRDAAAVFAYDRATGKRLETVLDRSHGLKKPIQIAVDEAGRIYVSDRGARTVFRRTADGAVTDLLKGRPHRPELPSGIAIDGSTLYVGDRKRKAILRVDLDKPDAHLEIFVGELPAPPEFFVADPDRRSKASGR